MNSGDSAGMLAELINANGRANDVGAIASMLNAKGGEAQSSGLWNNPFLYLIWLAFLGNRGGLFGGNQGAFDVNINDKLNSLASQIAGNQNANLTFGAIKENATAINGIASALGLNTASINASINGAASANALGQSDLRSAMQNCCCENKTLVQAMGYEGQIRDLQNTAALTSRIDQLANGIQSGFAQIGYNQTQQTQRILDQMCANATQELRDKLNAAERNAQTTQILARVGCGCGCNS